MIFDTRGTPAPGGREGINKGGNTSGHDNWHILALPGVILQTALIGTAGA